MLINVILLNFFSFDSIIKNIDKKLPSAKNNEYENTSKIFLVAKIYSHEIKYIISLLKKYVIV